MRFLITANSVGEIQLGMTVAEVEKAKEFSEHGEDEEQLNNSFNKPR